MHQKAFDEFANKAFCEPVIICGIEYNQVDALKVVDPETYEGLKAAWAEQEGLIEPQMKLLSIDTQRAYNQGHEV